MIPDQFKKPLPPEQLIILQYLHKRMQLPKHYITKIDRLQKGYKGEKMFFSLLKKYLPPDTIILHNLKLISNETLFQIDSLLIQQNNLFIFEVKNYKGDFFIKNDRWFKVQNNREIINPLLQIERSKYLLRHLLSQLGYRHFVQSRLIFINNEFSVYMLPLTKDIVLPTQIKTFIKELRNNLQNKINHHFTSKLIANHISKTSHLALPPFHFKHLRKGILCPHCDLFLSPFNRAYLICMNCHRKLCVERAIVNSINEYNVLFPNKKITTRSIHEWCHIIKSKKTIRRVLIKHYEQVGSGRYTYYI